MKETIRIFFLFAIFAVSAFGQKHLTISSPNGVNHVEFKLKDVAPGVNRLIYNVDYKGEAVILDSKAGLDMDNRVWEMAIGLRKLPKYDCWMDGFYVDSVSYSNKDSIWHPTYGERSTIRDKYNSGILYLSKKDDSGYKLNIEVRAYNEGIAFRYFLPEHPSAVFHKVVSDLTEYTLPQGTMAWAEQWAQSPFEHLPIDSITYPVERALTLELPGGKWMALTDADVDEWCLTKFKSSSNKRNTLTSIMYSPVDVVTYAATPWKVIILADKPGQLLEQNDIIQNLNPPCLINNTDWIKPGKIMRSAINTESGLATIDFCAAHNIPYILFDWKWYMPCTSFNGDATKVVEELDLPRVIAYGKEKGIGVWLYVNQHALMKQSHELFPLLHKWGIVGVKSGFVQYASNRWTIWLHDLVKLAAKNELMMNIHDEFRPSGFSRTFPNLLTQEGICGNEEWPDATHNVTLPFTRMINGAADYTICYFDKRLKNTHAHQLAASLVYYSPLETIFWYDSPELYKGEKEIEWFENLPTVWDDSKVLDGAPGKNITMARRKGEEWFLGVMTSNESSNQNIDLSFLNTKQKYIACIYTDGGDRVKSATHVKCTYFIVDTTNVLHFRLKPRGGAAIKLYPMKNKENLEYKYYKNEKL